MNLAPGTTLQNGKYLIKQVSGQKDVGMTLQATQAPSRPVILKTLNPVLISTSQYSSIKQQFNEQVNRFAQCRHPGLVRLIDSFEEKDLPFAVTDYTPGQTLAKLVKDQGVLSEATAVSYTKQIGAALEILHQHGLIHQNVTPQTIIHPSGSEIVVLVNLELSSSDSQHAINGAKTPKAGEYAAIECYQSQPQLTPASDLYSLAGVLYFLLTGNVPIAAPLRGQTAIVAPRQFRPQLSTSVETAILKGLEIHPKSRPTTIADWLAQLPAPAPKPRLSLPTPGQSQSPATVAQRHEAGNKTSHPQATPVQPRTASSHPNPYHPSMIAFPSKRFSGAFLTTAAVAAAIGVGSGLALRLAATTTGPGASFFHSEQSFPDLNGWPGEVTPIQQPAYVPPPEPPAQPKEYEFERAPVVPSAPSPQEAVIPQPEVAPASPAPEAPPAVVEPVAPEPVPAPAELAPEPSAPSMVAPEPAAPAPAAPAQPALPPT